MKLKALTTALAVAGALSAISVPAHAYVYANAGLSVSDLTINVGTIDQNNNFVLANATINSYTFSLQDTANLNNTGTNSDSATCGSAATACSTTAPVLDINAVNGNGSSVNRVNNNFALFGPTNAGSYSNADAVLRESQLVTGNPDSLQHISETNIANGGTSGLANATITSGTGFTVTFTVSGVNAFMISFSADADGSVAFIDPTATAGSTQSTLSTHMTLVRDGTSTRAFWDPDGSNGCLAAGGLVCSSVSEAYALNRNISLTTNGTQDLYHQTGGNFSLLLTGLTDGTYTLSLETQGRTVVSRVPEPASLALIGAGLAGLGVVGRKKRKQA